MKFNIIVAFCENRGIGIKGTLPWKLKSEMNYFTRMTTKCTTEGKRNAVIMGRNTWESIPTKYRPLQDRINVVVSKTLKEEECENVLLAGSFPEALTRISQTNDVDKIWVIGGMGIYKEALESQFCQKVYLTEIFKQFDCDVFFPQLPSKFMEIKDEDVPQGIQEENDIQYEIKVHENKYWDNKT